MVVFCFFLMDMQFILDGRYNQMDKDDYIFASMKLFADFVLIFGLILKLCD
jgi:FtsH-binding integral membrane protein